MRRLTSRSIHGYLLAAAVATAVAAGLVPAGAASLGGLAVASVSVASMPVALDPPAPLANSEFDGVASLDGWIDGGGKLWAVATGRFRGQRGAVRSQDKTAWAMASVDLAVSTGITVSSLLSGVNDAPASSGVGLALLVDGAEFVSVAYDRDRQVIEVGTVIGGSSVVIGSTEAPDLASLVIAATIAEGQISVAIDGVELLMVDVPSGFESHTAHGIVADNDNQTTFEWWRVEAIP
jgi:hypothetical protein